MTASNVVELRANVYQPLPEGYVNAAQLATLAGVTYRKVDYWTRCGYLQPIVDAPGSGLQRAFSTSEVAVARLINSLADDGLLPHVAAARARELLDTGTTQIAGMPIHLPEEF